MNPKDFRAWAHELADWMADYVEDSGRFPIQPDVEPGQLRAQFDPHPPADPQPFESTFADFRQKVVPGVTHWNHPGWFAYFPANHSPPSILAEMLTATLGAQCMSWETSPVATELEEVIMSWLGQMLDLPDDFTGVIQDTASTATLVALLTARERATRHEWGTAGPSSARPHRIYTTEHAHSSVAKAVKLAGFGLDNLVTVSADTSFRMDPVDLERAIAADHAAGYHPTAVVATVCTTSSTSVDPLPAIGEVAREHDLWMHVDAAYLGSLAILPEHRKLLDGIEYADSFVFNPHKWLFTNFDCSAYFVRDVDALLRTFSTSPEYLKTANDDEVKNFRDWGIQLGRRFRALKLWFVIRSYGVEGLREKLRHHLGLGRHVAQTVGEWSDFEVIGPTDHGLTCLRWNGANANISAADLDTANAAILARANAPNDVRFTHTKLDGRYVIRFCVGQLYTEREHVELGLQRLRDAADAVAMEALG
jgi:aromatic-L-amino-acid decarboxylase